MANFPFNQDKYKYSNEINGSPLNYIEALNLADKIMMWHSNNDTSDWTESNDGYDYAVENLLYGLIELLSDPNAIQRLEQTGEKVKENVKFIVKTDTETISNISDRWKNIKKYLIESFYK